MLAPLELEVIGDNVNAMIREADRLLGNGRGPDLVKCPWVARIRGIGSDGEPIREYLPGLKDYAKANSVGSRGVHLVFWLEDGAVYEVYERLSWKRGCRYYVRPAGGEIQVVNESEVAACLVSER